MPELSANLIRDYFPGSWLGKVYKNSAFEREIVFNWPKAFGKYSSFGIEEGITAPPCGGPLDDTRQVAIAGWHSNTRRWIQIWHNEYGGHGELQWTSQDDVNGVTVLYGEVHECKQESDDSTDHIIMCEIIDEDNFQYTIQSFKKGIVKIVFKRIRNQKDLKEILDQQAATATSFSELISPE